MSVSIRQEGSVGYVGIDHQPVNIIGLSVRHGLLEAVRQAESANLERVILAGRSGMFAADVEATEFDSAPLAPHLAEVLNAIEQSHVPWIAAIEGMALGSGAEIALACRMRIMAADALIGLPEVNLGVIPGAGGTQRLPRLTGVANALDMVTTGRSLSAQLALDIGLIHDIDSQPADAAFMVNGEALGSIVPARDLPAPAVDPAALAAARDRVSVQSPGQIAPQRVIDVIEKGLAQPFADGLAIERSTFVELRSSAQAKALRHLFFAERAAKVPAGLIASAVVPAHVAVAGGGTMGSAIACELLSAGQRVTILESDETGVERARANIDSTMAARPERDRIDQPDTADWHKRFTVTTDYAAAADARLAIEAVTENIDVKHRVFAAFEKALPSDAMFASATSHIDLNDIAGRLSKPSRLLGLHCLAPAQAMKLLELVRADATSDIALAIGLALARHLRKVPVVAGVCDGFIANRILARYHEAADTVLMDGSTPWEIDEAMVEFGFATGPYASQDLCGLDIVHANRRRQDHIRDPARRYIPIVERMVELGKLGRKTGAGWYRYPGGGGRVEDPIVADLALEEAHFAGIKRVDYSADEIRQRLLLAMINEAADVLHEGIAQTAGDIDLVTVAGYGFPRWRGGLMHYADTLGAKAIVAQLEQLGAEDPVAWKISPLLQRCAARGTLIVNAAGC